MKETSYLQIDLGRIEENIKALSDQCTVNGHAPGICAVIKKNAYGLGAVPVGARSSKAGCSMLGVYSVDEASEIITAGITAPVLLLGPLDDLKRTDPLYRAAISGQLHVSIHQPQELDNINRIGHTFATRICVHLYIDSGMSRGGLTAEQFASLAGKLDSYKHINLVGVYSHIARAADSLEFTLHQLEVFTKTLDQAQEQLDSNAKQSPSNTRIIKHIANTFATLRDPALHLDMVRPGLGILGYGTKTMPHSNVSLKPALRWKSKIVHVQRYPRNTPVGYGSTHTLRRDSFLGVVPAGYGDGYPLALSDKAQVLIELQDDSQQQYIVSALVVGQVNMDQIVIDLTDAAKAFGFDPENSAASKPNWVGATVELIGDDPDAPNSLENLARLAGSHCHEMLCRLSPRLPRHYIQ